MINMPSSSLLLHRDGVDVQIHLMTERNFLGPEGEARYGMRSLKASAGLYVEQSNAMVYTGEGRA